MEKVDGTLFLVVQVYMIHFTYIYSCIYACSTSLSIFWLKETKDKSHNIIDCVSITLCSILFMFQSPFVIVFFLDCPPLPFFFNFRKWFVSLICIDEKTIHRYELKSAYLSCFFVFLFLISKNNFIPINQILMNLVRCFSNGFNYQPSQFWTKYPNLVIEKGEKQRGTNGN